MKRIEQLAKLKASWSGTPPPDAASGSFSSSPSCGENAVFVPLHYESGYSYPLLVWLHGPESDQRQLMRVMPMVSMRNYLGVAPQGTVLQQTASQGTALQGTASQGTASQGTALQGTGLAAGTEVAGSGFRWEQTDDQIREAEQRIFDCIAAVRRDYHVDPRKIFVAGFDCGGTMAFRVALEHPGFFAGVLSLGGQFPSRRNPLARLNEVRSLPVFLASGRHGTKYPTETVCEHLRLLHTAGMPVTLRQYPCADELSPLMLADMDRWIMEQARPACSPPQEPSDSRARKRE